MLWTVPTGVSGLKCAEYSPAPLTKRSGNCGSPSLRPAPAHDLKSAEARPGLKRQIVAPRQHSQGESVGGVLARALAGEDPVAHGHREFLVGVGVARGDVGPHAGQGLTRFGDLLRQGADLPADAVLLVEVGGSELVELADFGIDLDLLHDGGIAGGDGLDLGVGERAAFEILGGADGGLAAHDLLDEAGLGFERLPHIGVERAFRDVAVDLDFRVEIALPQNAAFALLDVAGPPGRIQMMERGQAASARSCPRPSFPSSRSGFARARHSRSVKSVILAASVSASWMKAISRSGMPLAMSRARSSS